MPAQTQNPFAETPVKGIVEAGRKNVSDMTERELLEELVTEFRKFTDAANTFLESMNENPMLKAFMG